MNTAKIYYDSEANECTINQMVRREPEWAANIIQYYENKVAELESNRLEKLVKPKIAKGRNGHNLDIVHFGCCTKCGYRDFRDEDCKYYNDYIQKENNSNFSEQTTAKN